MFVMHVVINTSEFFRHQRMLFFSHISNSWFEYCTGSDCKKGREFIYFKLPPYLAIYMYVTLFQGPIPVFALKNWGEKTFGVVTAHRNFNIYDEKQTIRTNFL
jgi:hypothetical protein